MAIAFNGETKTITLSGAVSFAAGLIYSAAKEWEAMEENFIYASPIEATGKDVLSSGVYTDSIYKLTNGWKLKPSGYAQGSQILITGTLITSDGSTRTVAPSLGSEVTWLFQVASGATVVTVSAGSGLSQEEHTKLMQLPDTVPSTDEIASEVLKKDWSEVSGESDRSILNALRTLRNKVVIANGKITVYKEDGVTVAFEEIVTTDATALPITGVTP